MSAAAFTETLSLSRQINAPIERVFNAWTEADMLCRWFGPENFTVSRIDIDCRTGGSYKIELLSPDNTPILHWGEYIVVDKPNQLVFTWILENQDCQGSAGKKGNTLVDLKFTPINNHATEILLIHEKLPDKESYEGHLFGWESSFQSLQSILSESDSIT